MRRVSMRQIDMVKARDFPNVFSGVVHFLFLGSVGGGGGPSLSHGLHPELAVINRMKLEPIHRKQVLRSVVRRSVVIGALSWGQTRTNFCSERLSER